MKRTLLVAVSIMLLLFAFTACTNDNGSTSVDEDTAQNIAKEMNLNELVNDVFSAKEGDGVDITYTLGSDAQTQAAAVPRSTGYTLTATVTFDGYSYSSVTINSGVLRYIFTGSLTGSRFSASSYRIETERELVVQSSNASDTVDVVINVNETTEAAFSATLASTEIGETSIAANTQVSVSVTIPADDSVTIDNQPVTVPEEEPTKPDPEPVYLSATAMASDENISSLFGEGVTVDDVQSNVSITSNGIVTGSFNYVSAPNWGVDDEDEGYYLLVTFDVAEGAEVTVNDKTVVDNDWALFLGTNPEVSKPRFTVSAGGKSVTLTLSNSCVFNDPETPFDGGRGTEASPYEISSWEQLKAMKDYPGAYFQMQNDITVTEANANIESFSGVLDGNNHQLTLAATDTRGNDDPACGLVLSLSGETEIKNLVYQMSGIKALVLASDADITFTNVTATGNIELSDNNVAPFLVYPSRTTGTITFTRCISDVDFTDNGSHYGAHFIAYYPYNVKTAGTGEQIYFNDCTITGSSILGRAGVLLGNSSQISLWGNNIHVDNLVIEGDIISTDSNNPAGIISWGSQVDQYDSVIDSEVTGKEHVYTLENDLTAVLSSNSITISNVPEGTSALVLYGLPNIYYLLSDSVWGMHRSWTIELARKTSDFTSSIDVSAYYACDSSYANLPKGQEALSSFDDDGKTVFYISNSDTSGYVNAYFGSTSGNSFTKDEDGLIKINTYVLTALDSDGKVIGSKRLQ